MDNGGSTGDGNYWIDPSGSSAFEVLCDMTTDGGGWVVLANDDYSSDPCPGDWIKRKVIVVGENNPDSSGSAMSSFYNAEGVSFTEFARPLQLCNMPLWMPLDNQEAFPLMTTMLMVSLTLGEGAGNRSHLYSWALVYTPR